jgi:hypothetical protein
MQKPQEIKQSFHSDKTGMVYAQMRWPKTFAQYCTMYSIIETLLQSKLLSILYSQ